jgi:DNA repair protein RecO (recombination protein O)
MSGAPLRINLTPAFVLHQRPFRDTSLIVEVFARDHGRLTTFARGARGARGVRRSGTGRFASLQPFQRLLLSWHGRGEAPQLVAAESDGVVHPLPPQHWLSGCYLNELLLKLTAQHDPHPVLFELYERTLLQLAASDVAEPVLRSFEKRLLEELGFGLEFDCDAGTGEPIVADARYRLDTGDGLHRDDSGTGAVYSGRMLLALSAGELLTDPELLHDARALMRQAIDHCLEGRELRTRSVARSIARLERGAHAAGEASPS